MCDCRPVPAGVTKTKECDKYEMIVRHRQRTKSAHIEQVLVPETEYVRVPVHEDVPEVLEDGREVYPEHAVVLELRRLHVVLHGSGKAFKAQKAPGEGQGGSAGTEQKERIDETTVTSGFDQESTESLRP